MKRMSDDRLAEIGTDWSQSDYGRNELLQALKAEREKVVELEDELLAIRKKHIVTFPRIHGGFDVYDMSSAQKESVLRDKLTEMGWMPPRN